MKVLVATRRDQGARESDFCWAIEGELVVVPLRFRTEDVDGGLRLGHDRSIEPEGDDHVRRRRPFDV